MRKLMWFALSVVLMCAVTVFLDIRIALVLYIMAVILGLVAALLCKRTRVFAVVMILCIGMIAGFFVGWGYDAYRIGPARGLNGRTVFVQATVTDYSFSSNSGTAVQVEMEAEGLTCRGQLYLNDRLDLKPGDKVAGEFKLQFTGGEDGTYHFGNGIFWLGSQRGDVAVEYADRVPVSMYPTLLRQKILNAIDRHFPTDTAFFARALLLGDRTDVDYELNTAFKVTGISHIIAVSGMHVSILASAVYLLAAKRRYLMAVFGIPVVCLFAAVVGFTPSITRACIMQIMLLLALITDREYDPMTSLAVAALIMVGINPAVVTSVSFQLSFGCMAGIFLFSSRIYGALASARIWVYAKGRSFLGWIRKWICGSLSVTLGAMFFTTALCAYHFGAVSLVGLLTNLLTLWLVGLIFPGILIVCLLAFVCPPLAGPMAQFVSLGIRLLLSFVKWLAKFPLGAVYTQSPYVILWIVLCYAAILLYLLIKEKRGRVIFCTCVLALCVCLMCSWVRPNTCAASVTVLDVGQGQSVIISARGRHFLIDCGGDHNETAADIAAETLLSRGIFSLDGMIVTHYDTDHAGGVEYFMTRMPVKQVYLPPTEDDIHKPGIESMATHAVTVSQDTQISWADCKLTVFSPVLSTSDNESGICVLFESEKCDILITGDLSILGETLLISQKQLPDVDILIVGHHGSGHSTGGKLLDAVKPEYAFISVGKDNPYGHPAEQTIQRLEQHGCIIKRTDLHGHIHFRR